MKKVNPSEFAQFVKDHWDEVLSGHFVEQVNEAFEKFWFACEIEAVKPLAIEDIEESRKAIREAKK